MAYKTDFGKVGTIELIEGNYTFRIKAYSDVMVIEYIEEDSEGEDKVVSKMTIGRHDSNQVADAMLRLDELIEQE